MKAFFEHWKLLREVLRDHVKRGSLKYSEHARQRMNERNISRKAVEYILYREFPSEMHEPFGYPFGEPPYANPDPVFTVVGEYEGRKIAIAVAIKRRGREIIFSVVTAFEVSDDSRHYQR